jgi:hypothetical protein
MWNGVDTDDIIGVGVDSLSDAESDGDDYEAHSFIYMSDYRYMSCSEGACWQLTTLVVSGSWWHIYRQNMVLVHGYTHVCWQWPQVTQCHTMHTMRSKKLSPSSGTVTKMRDEPSSACISRLSPYPSQHFPCFCVCVFCYGSYGEAEARAHAIHAEQHFRQHFASDCGIQVRSHVRRLVLTGREGRWHVVTVPAGCGKPWGSFLGLLEPHI